MRTIMRQYGIKDEVIDEVMKFLKDEVPPRPGNIRAYREGNTIIIELP